MSKKDLINEYIGIIAALVIIILAIVGIYYYIKNHPTPVRKDMNNTTISLINTSHQKG